MRRLAAAGDDHARRQLASWLSDRAFPEGPGGLAKVEQAIEVIRPLADHDLLDELRDHISTGGGHYALRQLARRLIERDMSEALRELVEAADADTRPLILDAAGGASSQWMNAMRLLADFGHKASRSHLARTLAREGECRGRRSVPSAVAGSDREP